MATLAERQAFATSCVEKAKECIEILNKGRSDLAEISDYFIEEPEFARKHVDVLYARGMVNWYANEILLEKDFVDTNSVYEELLEWSIKLIDATKAFSEYSSSVVRNWFKASLRKQSTTRRRSATQ